MATLMATSSAREFDSSGASYSDTSGVSSLFYSTYDASHESTDSPNVALEPYLYEPVESLSASSSDT